MKNRINGHDEDLFVLDKYLQHFYSKDKHFYNKLNVLEYSTLALAKPIFSNLQA